MDRTLLTDTERSELATALPEWDIADTMMSRMCTFADFNEAMGFVTRVALAAERLDHHPDIDIRWNTVTVVLSTHSAGGLTSLDHALATQIDSAA